jgi:GTP-binding protein
MSINPFDEIALEEALRIKERGLADEVLAVSIGVTDTQQQLRTALAMGADRAILVQNDGALSPFAIATIFRNLVEREKPELVIVGKGEERDLQLELKLLADVGLVGFPNAGKSTFISKVSAARPKIADYPFTTLEPNLGVVDLGDFRTLVIADIPGLIEGAHTGAGLGDQFLRHIERTKMLLHLVDVSSMSGRETVADYETVNRELASYNPELAMRPQFVVATKTDALDEPDRLESLRIKVEEDGKPFFAISSATGEGVRELVHAIGARLAELKAAEAKPETVELAL